LTVTTTAGLLLAAGRSSRLGSPKQLLPFGRSTLLGHVLLQALNSDLDRVVLILGHQARRIKDSLGRETEHPKLEIVENTHYASGISSSITTGLHAVEAEFERTMILLADMPEVTTRLINHFLSSTAHTHSPLCAVKLPQGRSHPVIIGRQFYDELRRLQGDVGARHLFLKHPDLVRLIEPIGPYDGRDIDTMTDYLHFNEVDKDEGPKRA
jgi:molybdenum cofactor cytidylyltransferase